MLRVTRAVIMASAQPHEPRSSLRGGRGRPAQEEGEGGERKWGKVLCGWSWKHLPQIKGLFITGLSSSSVHPENKQRTERCVGCRVSPVISGIRLYACALLITAAGVRLKAHGGDASRLLKLSAADSEPKFLWLHVSRGAEGNHEGTVTFKCNMMDRWSPVRQTWLLLLLQLVALFYTSRAGRVKYPRLFISFYCVNIWSSSFS